MRSILTHCLTAPLLGLIALHGCGAGEQKAEDYIEAKPSFFALHAGDPTKNTWLRKPKNLLMLHETFKKLGYRNLIDREKLTQNPFIETGIYINKPLNQLLDSLEATYKTGRKPGKYFKEFWQRRKSEHNDQTVYTIIKEINLSLKNPTPPAFNHSIVNDTLYQLVAIERSNTAGLKNAANEFNQLKRLGFHQSAYNLFCKSGSYEGIKWNTDSLASQLTPSKTYTQAWFIGDNGP